MKHVLAVLVLFLAALRFATGQTMDDDDVGRIGRARDEEAIRKALADFVEAWNQHDARAFSLVFAEDADFTNVRGMSAHGHLKIEKFHAPRFATTFRDTRQTITEVKIRCIKPDVAADDAWWEMTGAKTPEGREIPLRKGLLNFIMTREVDW